MLLEIRSAVSPRGWRDRVSRLAGPEVCSALRRERVSRLGVGPARPETNAAFASFTADGGANQLPRQDRDDYRSRPEYRRRWRDVVSQEARYRTAWLREQLPRNEYFSRWTSDESRAYLAETADGLDADNGRRILMPRGAFVGKGSRFRKEVSIEELYGVVFFGMQRS